MGQNLLDRALGLAQEHCDRIALMFKGSILESYSLKGTQQQQQTAQALHPYTQQLQDAKDILAGKKSLDEFGAPQALSCPTSVDSLCPFLLRCPRSGAVCLEHKPPLLQLPSGHEIRCHLLAESASGSAGTDSGTDTNLQNTTATTI